jgi:hypothetical protein
MMIARINDNIVPELSVKSNQGLDSLCVVRSSGQCTH